MSTREYDKKGKMNRNLKNKEWFIKDKRLTTTNYFSF